MDQTIADLTAVFETLNSNIKNKKSHTKINRVAILEQLQRAVPWSTELKIAAEQFEIHSTVLTEAQIPVKFVEYTGGIRNERELNGYFDTGAQIAVVREIPKSAQIEPNTVIIRTANGTTEERVYRFPIVINDREIEIRAIRGDIPADIFLSPEIVDRAGLKFKLEKTTTEVSQ